MKDVTHINTTKIIGDAFGFDVTSARKVAAYSTYPDDEMRSKIWRNPLIFVKWGFEHSYIRGPIMCALHAKKAHDLFNRQTPDPSANEHRIDRALYHLGCASHYIVDMATPFHSEASRMLNHVPGGSHPMFESFVDQQWGGLLHLMDSPSKPIYRNHAMDSSLGKDAFDRFYGTTGYDIDSLLSGQDVYSTVMGLACRVSLDSGLQFPSVFEAWLSKNQGRKLEISHDTVERCLASTYIMFDMVLGSDKTHMDELLTSRNPTY